MAGKGKSVARKPSTRTRGASSRRQPSQEAARYETPAHAERGELVVEWKVLHERVINFRGKRDTFREHIARRGWDFMYDPTIDINMTLVREFYANCNEKNQGEVYMRGRKIPCHLRDIEGATWLAIPGRVDKNLLNKDAWMWMKLVVSNIMPTRHETTLGIDHILLIYALMAGMSVSFPGVMVATMNDDPVKTKKQLLPFPMFITKWAAANEVPTYPGDEIFKPASRTRAPTSSHSSSSQQSRDDLMRTLRRNERIMHRHEQLMLMLHPDLDISQLQQISSPEVSEQQQQAASDSDDGDSSDEDRSDEESSEE
ncbi:hypothetical protein PIB30_082009 [Stylosanthes scabra]|uniref:Putative plant transposon protein domain-containing protein n=1 Tax=Stylosanthes scabra TaxID=79078 RepID=A0ABU6SS47_9FABA|nr:hypothetical protein [Stylosanthes scabra]